MSSSKEYEAAIKVHDAACRIYQGRLAEYRAMAIGDEDFLMAKAAMSTADVVFDVAFAKEAERPEEVVEPGILIDKNLDLFTKS